MDNSDWSDLGLGITIGLVETICPKLGTSNVKGAVKSLFFTLSNTNESALNAKYYYISAKTQTEFAIFAAATVAAAGSYSASYAAFSAAGVTATAAGVSFAGTGGLGTPVSITMGVASITSLIASGVCLVAGGVLTAVALDARDKFKADSIYHNTATATAIPGHLGKIAGKPAYAEGGCVAAATAMAQYLTRKKFDYKFAEVDFRGDGIRNYIVSTIYSKKFISDNGHHVGIYYNGKVYCTVHNLGLELNAWFNDFTGLGGKYKILTSSYKTKTQINVLIDKNQILPNIINNIP